ncbi:MAG TPA: GntR family transcriptional regulator [Actinocrinis sp.]|nr:GntR family transcriptional regulator [Actinocrinis sp.]
MTPTDDTALWRTIADQLRSDIADEVYQPGSPLPGEILMADRYNTSRPTVRRAIAELAGEGLLTAAHGRGTYVRPRPDRRTILINTPTHPDLFEERDPRLTGWTREPHPEAARRRANGLTKADEAIITTADRDQAETLRISTGTMVIYRYAYWRHIQTHRVISVTSVVPAHLLGIFEDPDQYIPDPDDPRDAPYFSRSGASRPDDYEPDLTEQPDIDEDTPGATPAQLYPALTHRHGPVTFTTTVTARMPRGDELNTLGMDTGTPLLRITRTMIDTHGRPLEAAIIEAPADRFDATSTPDPTTRPILEL